MKKHILSIMLIATIATQSQPMQRLGINRIQAHVGAAVSAAVLPSAIQGARQFCQTAITREQSKKEDLFSAFVVPRDVLDPASKLPAIERINLAGKSIRASVQRTRPSLEVMKRVETMNAKYFNHMKQEIINQKLNDDQLTNHFIPILENMPLEDIKEFISLYQYTEQLVNNIEGGINAFLNAYRIVFASLNPQEVEKINIKNHPDFLVLKSQLIEIFPWFILSDKQVTFKVLSDKLSNEKK